MELEISVEDLLNKHNHVPFDLRPNYQATEDDISVPLLIEHLKIVTMALPKPGFIQMKTGVQ
ncbi:MAG: hypothetical protein LUF00_05440 [Lachnospiraceae bacterium]|nr:hypothetical protein [Lachnospiraceae bacterium]